MFYLKLGSILLAALIVSVVQFLFNILKLNVMNIPKIFKLDIADNFNFYLRESFAIIKKQRGYDKSEQRKQRGNRHE